jgi:riboflavin biosynthesis pyrimidine reductase
MKKPRIICHMVSTINGKIITENFGDKGSLYSALYQTCHESFDSEAWLCGRVTLEKDFTKGQLPELRTPPRPIARIPFFAHEGFETFAIAIDAAGKLGWDTNEISGDHIIAVLTEYVSDEYLYFLQQKSISYIFAGDKEIDFEKAISLLSELFPITTIMLEGGGHINGAFMQRGLIDEISMLIVPVADATPNTPTAFEAIGSLPDAKFAELKLREVEQLDNGVVWLKYDVEPS